MNINIIFAISKNNAIGINGKLPWYIKEDLKHFKKTTTGNGNNAIIMGRKTWNSIGSKPLKNRHNIIISKSNTNNNNNNNNNFNFFDNIDKSLMFCREKNFDEIWIIGGSSIYSLFLNKYKFLINKLVVTFIDENYNNCDTFIDFNFNDWSIINKKKLINYNNVHILTLINKISI